MFFRKGNNKTEEPRIRPMEDPIQCAIALFFSLEGAERQSALLSMLNVMRRSFQSQTQLKVIDTIIQETEPLVPLYANTQKSSQAQEAIAKLQLRAGRIAEAVRLARKIDNANLRDNVLSSVIQKQIEVKDWNAALETLRFMQLKSGTECHCKIAVAMGDARGIALLEGLRKTPSVELARAFLGLNEMDKAYQTILELPTDFGEIGLELHPDPIEQRRIIRKLIDSFDSYCNMWTEIAAAFTRAGNPEKTYALLKDRFTNPKGRARNSEESARNSSKRILALVECAKGLKNGERDIALQWLKEGITYCWTLESPTVRESQLWQVFCAFLVINALDEAEQVCEYLQLEYYKALAFANLAPALAMAGHGSRAQSVIRKAEQIACSMPAWIPDDWDNPAEACQIREYLQLEYSDATRLQAIIFPGFDRDPTKVFPSIARAYLKMEMPDQAFELIKKVPGAGADDFIEPLIEYFLANHQPDRSLDAAYATVNGEKRFVNQLKLAVSLFPKQPELASGLFSEVTQVAKSHARQTNEIMQLLDAYLVTDQIEKAIGIADEMEDPSRQVGALCSIAMWSARQSTPLQAELLSSLRGIAQRKRHQSLEYLDLKEQRKKRDAQWHIDYRSTRKTAESDPQKAILQFNQLFKSANCLWSEEGALADAYHSLGELYEAQSDWNNAQANYEKALKVSLSSNWKSSSKSGLIYNSLAVVFAKKAKASTNHQLLLMKLALHYYKRALRELLFCNDLPTANITSENLAACLSDLGQTKQALQYRCKAAINVLGILIEARPKLIDGNTVFLLFNNAIALLVGQHEFESAVDISQTWRLFIRESRMPPKEQSLHLMLINAELAQIYASMCEYDRAIAHCRSCLNIALELTAQTPELSVKMNCTLADIYHKKGNLQDASVFGLKALAMAESFAEKIESYLTLAKVYQQENKVSEAIKAADSARRIAEEKELSNQAALAYMLSADLFLGQGNIDRALEQAKCGWLTSILNRIVDTPASMTETSLKLGEMLSQRGDRESAGRQFQRALLLELHRLDPDKILVARLQGLLAHSLGQLDTSEEHQNICTEALISIREMIHKGINHLKTDSFKLAQNCFEVALESLSHTIGSNHIDFVHSCLLVAQEYSAINKHDQAIKILEPACQDTPGKDPHHPIFAKALELLHRSYTLSGRYDEAKSVLDRQVALGLIRSNNDEFSPIPSFFLVKPLKKANHECAQTIESHQIGGIHNIEDFVPNGEESERNPNLYKTDEDGSSLTSLDYNRQAFAAAPMDLDLAIGLQQKAIAASESSPKLDYDEIIHQRIRLSQFYLAKDCLEEAERELQKASAGLPKLPNASSCHRLANMGWAELEKKKGNNQEAIEYFLKEIAIGKENQTETWLTENAYQSLGLLYFALDDVDRAIEVLEEGLHKYSPDATISREIPVDTAIMLLNLGSMYSAKKWHEKALELQGKAYLGIRKQFGSFHSLTETALKALAASQGALGLEAQAIESLEQALESACIRNSQADIERIGHALADLYRKMDFLAAAELLEKQRVHVKMLNRTNDEMAQS